MSEFFSAPNSQCAEDGLRYEGKGYNIRERLRAPDEIEDLRNFCYTQRKLTEGGSAARSGHVHHGKNPMFINRSLVARHLSVLKDADLKGDNNHAEKEQD